MVVLNDIYFQTIWAKGDFFFGPGKEGFSASGLPLEEMKPARSAGEAILT